MSQNVMLRAKGLFTFQNQLSEVPTGAMFRADNAIVDRDGTAESRRGFSIYGNAMGITSDIRAKQLLRYKGRVLRHYDDILQFDNGSGTFTSFSGTYMEVETGLRIKGLEVNGNFYFTTNDGIKKISATSAAGLSASSGFITDAGGVQAIDIEGSVNYTNPGFFTENSTVAYRVVWGIKDVNTNLILGAPSSRIVLANVDPTNSANVDLTINIPQAITENHFYQVYRTAVKEAGATPIDEVDPGDEMYLVIEDFPSSTDISNGFVEVEDITPEDFRSGGALLYTNPISGDGILQANTPPPLAKDIALFKGATYYANTKTRHNQTISLLSILDFVSGSTKFIIANQSQSTIYTFTGAAEKTTFTFDTAANTAQSSYFILYSANDSRKYVVWFNKDAGGTQPSAGDTAGALFIEVAISTGDTAAQVRGFIKTAMDAADNNDFSYVESLATLAVTCVSNGTVTNASAGATPPGGAFAIVINTQGQGEDASTQKVLLSNNASVAQAVDETARSLVRIINKQASETVYAFYLSGPDDVPGQILLQSREQEDISFYVAISDSTLVAKWNPTLPYYTAITTMSTANPTVVTAVGHGLVTGDQVVINGTNSTPTRDGIYTVTVTDADHFTIPTTVTVAGTAGTVFKTTVASDNEVSPNRVFFSKSQQPEAVPIVNFLDVGPKDQAILRIVALRDSLFVLKTDGVYRLSGEIGQIPTVTLFDNSVQLFAPDSAATLNNQIYGLTTQGITTISDTGVSIISRPIEDQVLKRISEQYTDSRTAAFALGYESDRAYIVFMVTNTTDEVATQAFRFNTFTSAWTRWPISKTCGVIGGDDKIYFGAGDTNRIEKERKEFSRKDYTDREFNVQLPANPVKNAAGTIFNFASANNMEIGDMIVQTQYVTRARFNFTLRKLDRDIILDDADYYNTLHLDVGANLPTQLEGLVDKLNNDDDTRHDIDFAPSDVNTSTNTITSVAHGFTNEMILRFGGSGDLPAPLVAATAYYAINVTPDTFQLSATLNGAVIDLTTQGTGSINADNFYTYSGTIVPVDIQTEFNLIIQQLNNSTGVGYFNYLESVGTVEQEALILSIDKAAVAITVNVAPSWIEGDATLFKAIDCTVQWAPQSMQDPSLLKQVREGTVLFENTAFYGAQVSYRSDLSRNFEMVPFLEDGNGEWGFFPWGEQLWGGEGSTIPKRTLIPQQKQRCRYIDCLFEHKWAREKFALYGISLTYENNSTRAYR